MEFNLITQRSFNDCSNLRSVVVKHTGDCVEVTRKHILQFSHLTLSPVVDEDSGFGDKALYWKYPRERSIDLLFGNSNMAKQLKTDPIIPITSHFTITSSKTGRLMIETKLVDYHGVEIDVLEHLQKLQDTLPSNSIEFTVGINGFGTDGIEEKLDFIETGLKLKQNEWGSVRLEMTNIHFPGSIWYDEWCTSINRFFGNLSLNVKLEAGAVAELYKRHFFGGGPLTTELGTASAAADMVILVTGKVKEDKDEGFVSAIQCQKSSLSEASPVFAAMFQAGIVDAKEGTLEITEFSERCVRALLEFASRQNVEEALKSGELALELLQAAEKYEMKKLIDILQHMIWYMPCNWFSADMAIKLVSFTKKVGDGLGLAEEKVWRVLKWYANNQKEKLMESKEYVTLSENSVVMRELGELLSRLSKN